MTLPIVSVVVVNYNGLQHLEACFRSLQRQDYPAELIELILVDNGSQDGSLEFMESYFPTVKVLRNPENRGFAPAVNYGAETARGEYLALINNDAYADPSWLKVLVTTALEHRDEGVVCVGAKLLDWHGRYTDFVSGGINLYGMGNQFFHRLPVDDVDPAPEELLFACGGAMLIDRQIFLDVGGFDGDFFMYFEDVDLGWRLWVYGYRVRFAPDAVVYHRQHATSNAMYNHQLNTLFERNALLMVLKNYDEQNLNRILGYTLLLMVGRSLSEAGAAIDRNEFKIGYRDPNNPVPESIPVPRMALSYWMAFKDVLEDFPHIWEKRTKIQNARARADADIFPLFGYPMGASYHQRPYLQLQQVLVESFGLRELFAGLRTSRVLILSNDPLYEKLAGPGIRAVEMARYLARDSHVILAAPDRCDVSIPDVATIPFDRKNPEALEQLSREVEVIVIQGSALHHYPFLKSRNRMMVIDLYDPFHLENLQLHSRFPIEEAYYRTDFDRKLINDLLETGDYFICASERQRDFWLGALGSIGRLSPDTYRNDPTFSSLIGIVPFGIDPVRPVHTTKVLKGVHPAIAATDTVLLWGGGIWDWLDPLTVIRAMDLVRSERPDIKLFFLGGQHPNAAEIPLTSMYHRAVALAEELGLLGKTVLFNEQWVPYTERANYFLEADIGVSAHLEHIETHFAFRTRLLDYIWTGLPMVIAGGDTLADTVAERELGYVAGIEDYEGFAQAILALASEADARAQRAAAFAAAQHDFSWPEVLKPLIAWSRQPNYSPRWPAPPGVAAAREPAAPILPSTRQHVRELETAIAQKNEHISYLEGLIKQIQGGKMMQVLGRFNRLRSR